MSDSNELRVKWFGCHLIWDSIDLVVNWFEIQVIWLSIDVCFKWFWLSVDLNFKWCGCQLIWDSNDLVVNRFEIQMSWLSIDLRFKRFGCQMTWGSSDLVVNWYVIQMILSNEAFVRDFLQNWSFESQKRNFSARLPSKLKLWSSKAKLFCETSFKIQALKLKNEAFLRDFFQHWSFEAQKRSISARLPSKMKLWSSKTKLFCETSFKPETLKIKNEAFLRDFLQTWSVEDQKRSISARLPSKMKHWRSKTKLFCETSFKNDMSTRHLASKLQYVLAIFKWMLQKYCACHEKVAPTHTKSCNYHAKWSLQNNTSMTWNLQPFHGFCVKGFKHRHHKARSHCACHAKHIVPDPLEIHLACQRFCNPHELLCLPRILQCVEIPAPTTQNTLWSSKNAPRPSVFNDLTSKSLSRTGVVQFLRSSTSKSPPKPSSFNDFHCQIALARRRSANFVDVNFQKCSDTASF